MSKRLRRWITPVLVLVGVAGAGALTWLPLGAADQDESVRDIVLVARRMAFHEASDSDAINPTLSLPAGGRVRVTLRNEEPGVSHSFAIPAWSVESGSVVGPGVVSVEFVVPRAKGREAYQCTPHATMMRGGIVVR